MHRLPFPVGLLALAASIIGAWGAVVAVGSAVAGLAEPCRLGVLVAAASAAILLAIYWRFKE